MSNERLLLVDDDPAILDICRRVLETEGFTVVQAKRGEDALAKLQAEPFDLLLTDIRLPGLDGLEMVRRLRESAPELPVVTMTGYSNMEMAIQALSFGVDGFLVKPFTLDTLRLTITRALEKRRIRRELLRLSTLEPLLKTARELASARTRDGIYECVSAAVRPLLETEQIAFFEIGSDNLTLTVASVNGEQFALLCNQNFPLSQIVEGQELFGAAVTVWNERDTPRLPFDLPGVTWLVAAPFVTRDKPIGFLLAAVPFSPSAGDSEAMRLIMAQASAALENVDLLNETGRALVAARQAERVKGELINIAAQELNAPLTTLVASAELVRGRVTGDLYDSIADILEQAARIQHLTDEMRMLQSVESGRLELHLERCALDQVVRRVVGSCQPLVLEREQTIDVEVEDSAGAVTADRAMLRAMLGSLVSNAIKFSPRHARLQIAARGDAANVTFQVRDLGKSLPEQGGHVTDAFYRANSALTRDAGGLGTGLTLVRDMVAAHGGKIWFESAQPGGTSFNISLPREPRHEPHPRLVRDPAAQSV